MPRKTDKRDRLIMAARDLIHKQGFNLTTLADIAQDADVPLGNVYYYFKTKEAIGEAVIAFRAVELNDRLQLWENNPDIRGRLSALISYEMEQSDVTARCGCPVGGLCQELAKQGGALAEAAAQLLNHMVEWSEKQFRNLGLGEKSKEYALQFISLIQGMALMTNTFKEPKMTAKLGAIIEQWIDSVAGKKSSVSTTTVEDAAMA